MKPKLVVLVLLFFVLFSIDPVLTPASGKGEWAKLGMPPLEVKDVNGKILDYGTISQMVVIRISVAAMKSEYVDVPFTLITEIRDQRDVTVFLETVELVTNTNYTEGYANSSFSWLPDNRGKHSITVTAISNLTSPEILAGQRMVELSILGKCNPPKCLVLGDDAEYRQDYRMIGTVREGPAKQKSFTGLFSSVPDDKCRAETLLRCTPYKLDGMSVYTGADNLDDYVGYYRIRDRHLPSFEWVNLDEFLGHRVEIVGKIFKYSGSVEEAISVEEIVPVRIRMID